jgi:hypothetical protein
MTLRSWLSARRSDPIPVLLTSGGCVISAAALVFGRYYDARGVASNVIADLILIRPALFLSNIVVRRIQDARARERIAPLVHVIAGLLYCAVPSAAEALKMLETEVQLDVPGGADEQMTLADVESALAQALTQLDAATQGRELSESLGIGRPLSLPRFGVIRRLVQQADNSYPMPRMNVVANIAEYWAERCGVDFFVLRRDGTSVRRRLVGLSQVEEQSKTATAATRLGTESYLGVVRGCLRSAHGVARRLSEQAPEGLPHGLPPNVIDVSRTLY